MTKGKKESYEYRYYELSAELPILALTGDSWLRQYDQTNELHFHNYPEFGHCIKGHGRLQLEKEALIFETGSISFIPAYLPHATISDADCQWEYLFLDMEGFLTKLYVDRPLFAAQFIEQMKRNAHMYTEDNNQKLAEIMRYIIEESKDKKPYYKEYIKGLLLPFLVEVKRMNPENNKEILQQQLSNPIAFILTHIHTSFMEPLRITDLAAIAHMSESHFRRCFEEIMHMTPLDYINQVRILRACELLSSTDLSISAVSTKCGFCAISTFLRNFDRVIGTTPLKWRKDSQIIGKERRNCEIKTLYGWLE